MVGLTFAGVSAHLYAPNSDACCLPLIGTFFFRGEKESTAKKSATLPKRSAWQRSHAACYAEACFANDCAGTAAQMFCIYVGVIKMCQNDTHGHLKKKRLIHLSCRPLIANIAGDQLKRATIAAALFNYQNINAIIT